MSNVSVEPNGIRSRTPAPKTVPEGRHPVSWTRSSKGSASWHFTSQRCCARIQTGHAPAQAGKLREAHMRRVCRRALMLRATSAFRLPAAKAARLVCQGQPGNHHVAGGSNLASPALNKPYSSGFFPSRSSNVGGRRRRARGDHRGPGGFRRGSRIFFFFFFFFKYSIDLGSKLSAHARRFARGREAGFASCRLTVRALRGLGISDRGFGCPAVPNETLKYGPRDSVVLAQCQWIGWPLPVRICRGEQRGQI